MTKEELLKLDDSVRVQAEILQEHLKDSGLPAPDIYPSQDEGIIFFFQTPYFDLHMTADIEINPEGITASVIPYKNSDNGLRPYSEAAELVELWEVQEETPFVETVAHIKSRLTE